MVADVNFDVSGIEKFEKQTLKKIKNIALPLAIKGTLNSAAFQTMKKSRQTIKEDFEARNRFTERSVRVDAIKTLKIVDMVATVGSIAPYMKIQEEGGTLRSKGKYGLRIPTGRAAGQKTLFPRKKAVQKRFRRGQLKLSKATAGKIAAAAKSRKQFILMSIRVAALRGQSPFVFLPLGKKKTGVFRVLPRGAAPSASYKRGRKKFRRSFKWGKPKGTPGMEKLIMIHSFSHKTVKISATGWLSKNVEKTTRQLGKIFEKEADRIFERFAK